jgi:hypothetical protein
MYPFAQRLILCPLMGLFFAIAGLAVSIEVQVVDSASNEPVPNADLTLACLNAGKYSRMCKETRAKTAADGTFSFDHLWPVRYSVKASGESGLVATRKSQTEVELDYKHSSVSVVLKLEPESAISGKVVGEDGQPRSDIGVVALKQSASGATTQLTPVSRAVSDQAGGYAFQGLVPGNYYVVTTVVKPRIEAGIKTGKADTFFLYAPSAVSLEDAIPKHVEIGQTYSGVELHLRPLITYKIQGRAQMETAERVVSGDLQLRLYPRDSSGVTAPSREIVLNPDGRFEANVLPGDYTLRLTGTTTILPPAGSKTPPAMMPHLLAKQDIEVSGKDVYGIILLMPPPFTINGHVYMEGAPDTKIEKPEVSMKPVDLAAASGCQTIRTGVDGTFTITNCDAANYVVRYSPPAGAYIKAITLNNQDAMTHVIDLASCAGGELKIVLRPGAASIAATVGDQSGKAFDVVLIPESWTDEMIPVIHAIPQNGQFSARGLAPGFYSVIAAAGVDRNLWNNAAFVHQVQALGTPVDLGENEQKQVVVAPLTEDEADQIELRLGLY